MSDKEAVLNLLQNLPSEVSLDEIQQGIEQLAAARGVYRSAHVAALRTSAEAASILSQALADHHARKNGSEN